MILKNLQKLIKKLQKNIIKDNKKKMYIWYCPECNGIIFKTDKPFLYDNITIMCRNCDQLLTSEQIFRANEHNIRRYLETI